MLELCRRLGCDASCVDERGIMSWMNQSALAVCLMLAAGCGKSSGGGGGSSTLGSAVTSNADILGTWDLTGFSIQDYPQEQIALSGRASIRFRADGATVNEFKAYSSSFGGEMLYERCTGYESGKFSVANGVIIRSDIISAGVSGNCYDVRSPPSAIDLDDMAMKAFINGTTLTLTNDTTILQQGVSKKITILRTLTKRSDETWDGSGIDPALSGTYKLANLYIDYACKSDDSDRFKGALSLGGSLTLKITGNTYTETQTNFKMGALDACTAVTNGSIQPGSLTTQWSQSDSSHDCAKKSSDPNDVVHFDREVIGLPSQEYVSMASKSYPDETCENGYAHSIEISVFERQ